MTEVASPASTKPASARQYVEQARALLPEWLHDAHQTVLTLSASDRFPHALLLSSPLGWCERRLAAVVVCELLGLTPRLNAEEIAHPDLKWLEREDGSLFYKVAQIRDAVGFIQRTAQGNGKKVIVVPHAHRMNVESANALLKVLEEPPPGSHWLLLSSEPAQLLPTIRSRCQTLVIAPAADMDTDNIIVDLVAATNPEIAAAVNPVELAMLQFEFLGAPEQVATALLVGEEPIWPLLAGVVQDRDLIGSVAERWTERELPELLAAWQRYVHAIVAARLPEFITGDEYSAVSVLARQRAGAGSQSIDRVEKLFKFVDELREARQLVTYHAGINRRLLLERLLLRFSTLLAIRGK